MTIYGAHSPVRRWKAHVKGALTQVTFVSPFVTSNTAERVLLAGDPSNVRLLTTFSALNFVHGSSSLVSLRRLVSAGSALFHLPNLHAKVLIVRGLAFTIGSQNLTNAGNRNAEMTIYGTDGRLSAEVSSVVEDWISKASPITPEMIDDMERLVVVLRRAYLKLMKGVSKLDEQVAEAEQARREHIRTQAEQDKLINQLAAEAARATKHSTNKYARVEYVESGYGQTGCDTLIARDQDLLSWSWGDQPAQLRKTNRYLCVIPEQSRVGWVRVMKTRITKVGGSIDWTRPLFLGDRDFHVGFRAAWKGASKNNVHVLLDKGDITIRGFFTLAGFSVDVITPKRDASPSILACVAMLRINRQQVEDRLAALILRPFTYTHKLLGAEAREFFGEHGSSWKLMLGRYHQQWFLVASRQ